MKLWTKVFWLHYTNICIPVTIMLWMAHFIEPHLTAWFYTMPLWAPLILYVITLAYLAKK